MTAEVQELNDGVYFLRGVVWLYVSWSPCTVLLEEPRPLMDIKNL